MADATANHQPPRYTPSWIDERTGIDMSKWWRDPEILALLDRQIKELNDFADRIERAQAALRAHLIKQGKIPASSI